MHTVLTLIAPANAAKLRARASFLNYLRAQLNPVRTVWLSEDACDLLLEDRPSQHTLHSINNLIDEQKIDSILQPVATRSKKLFVADMDSTMIEQECLDELADVRGIKSQIADITARAMRGEMDFADSLRARMALLKGMTLAQLDAAYRERITLTPGAEVLLATLKHRGIKTLLVSGGFRFFTTRVAATLGFDAERGNDFVIDNTPTNPAARLTGEVAEPILDQTAKRAALLQAAQLQRLALSQTLAVGDGANDLSMLQTAGLGVAYHAKPVVEQAAPACIRHNDLTALLYAQGIAKTDWK